MSGNDPQKVFMPHLKERLESSKEQGIDIVDYDFKGGIRVQTNRMFMDADSPSKTSEVARKAGENSETT
jgi:hypothetical protein